MKKVLSLLLAFVMVISILTVTQLSVGAAVTDTQNVATTNGDFLYYVLDDGTACISGYEGSEKDIVIPDTIDGHMISVIGAFAFAYNNQIESVVISNNVTVIEDAAFGMATNLREVTLSNNLERIGVEAFAFTEIVNIDLPDSLKSVGEDAFFASLVWSNSPDMHMRYVDDVLCYAQLWFLDENDGEKRIKDVEIKEGTRIIADFVFNNEDMLESVKIPSSIQYIGDAAFQRCTGLTEVSIPEGVIELGECAFWGCENLTEVNLPDSLTTMESGVFYNCTSLTEITLPNNFEGTTEQILAGCDKLQNIYINPNNQKYTSLDGVLYSKDVSTLILFPCGRTYNPSEIPNTVKTFGDYAFAGNHKIIDFVFPDNIERAGIGMIMDSDVENITFPASMEVIDEGVTYGCYKLKSTTVLNPSCVIVYEDYTIYETATIYGYENSTAQEYAEYYEREFVSLGNAPETPTEPEIFLGDVDGDGQVSVMDATAIQQHMADIKHLSEEAKKPADTDKDGIISVMDATQIQRFVAQLITEF